MKRAAIILLAILCILSGIATYVVVYRVLPYSPIRPHRITRDELARIHPGRLDPGALGLAYDALDVTVEDTIVLRGWFIHAHADSVRGTMVLLHGIANCKESLLGFADTLARLGYNCIVYDSRANGESGGLNCTFGYYEKYDVSAYIDAATKRFPGLGPVGIYGNSLGAAVAIQAMAIDKRITCGIVESPFATLREVVYDYWKRMSGIPLRCVIDKALENSERIAHFTVDDVRPEQSARQVTCPVLVVHGEKDEHIAAAYGRRVFDNIAAPGKEWYLVSGGDHFSLARAGGDAYLMKLSTFLRRYL
jgi:alpha-beta hydrolase superfamily lysophospholipase